MHDELKPGIDRPRRGQYVVLVLIVTLLAIAGYFYRRAGTPLPGAGHDATTGRVTGIAPDSPRRPNPPAHPGKHHPVVDSRILPGSVTVRDVLPAHAKLQPALVTRTQ